MTSRAERGYTSAPLVIQRAFDEKIKLLLVNLRHPSLHAKKYDQANDIWQARVNRDWRFYFIIQEDTYMILDIIRHPK